MKGLLQSKKFKNNLKKWLFMYVGALLLLTTVVTYSKYVTERLSSNDEARVTKFNVKFERTDRDGNICNNESESNDCKTSDYLPNEDMKFYFLVDISEVEVKADLYVTIKINEMFKDLFRIKSIKNLTTNNDTAIINGQSEEIYILVDDNEVTSMVYEVTVNHQKSVINSELEGQYDVVVIDYLATQI